ncbi:hypothetical protein IV203_018600 [Nitzschia inconspicua]|uniref:Uncharacterized protein n=1 Tax=Nitzschia inconspicua TaxID=303405 RepID=A0A9K3M264_9STRA|nr:hypothetical protein IV203_018600 [Nitzschia inconspicua]
MSNSSSLSNSSCPVVPPNGYALPLETYYNDPSYDIRPIYNTTVAMERIFRWIYRWNKNSDLPYILGGDATRDDEKSYLIGLLWASFALLLFALLWLLLLICFKWWGPKRVGFFSARRLRPPPPQEPTEALEKREQMYKSQKNAKGGVPFQHNGIALGFDEMGKPTKKKSKTKKFVKGTIRAPKKLVKSTIKAPGKLYNSQKKKFQQTFHKSKKFARINSAGEIDLTNYLNEETQTKSSSGIRSVSSPNSPGNNQEGGPVLIMTQDDERAIRDYEVELERYYQICDARNTRLRRIRATTAVCAIGVVTAAVMFVIMGIPTLWESSKVTESAISMLQQRARVVQQAVLELQSTYQETSIAVEKFILDVNEFCPNAAEEFCSNVQDSEQRDCDFSTLPQLETELNVMIQYLDRTFELVVRKDALEQWYFDLLTLDNLLNRATAYYPKTLNWAFWVAVGCNLTLASICVLICIAAMLLYFGHPLPLWLKRLRSFVMVPTFLVLVVLGWIFSSAFVVSSIGGADACINSPDAFMLSLLNRLEGEFSTNSVLHDFLKYYVRGCPVESAPKDLDQRIVIMTQLIVPSLQDFRNAMDRIGLSNLQQLCGGADLTIFISKINALETQLCELSQSFLTTRMLLNCPNWVQWYQLGAYEGMCYYASTGFAWAASTQIVMMVLSMIILTLRVSFFELNEVADEGTQCTSNWCCCVQVMPDDEDDDEDESEEEYHTSDVSENYEEEVPEEEEDEDLETEDLGIDNDDDDREEGVANGRSDREGDVQ